MKIFNLSEAKNGFRFLLFGLLALGYPVLAQPTAPISPNLHVDQFGYVLNAKKIAVLSSPQTGYNVAQTYTPGPSVQVRKWADGTVAFTGTPAAWGGGQTHAQSGDKAWWVDFSALTTAGSYYLFDPTNNVRSERFELDDAVYQNVLKAAVRVFFYQRSGFAKTAPYAGAWTDGAAFLGTGQDTQCRLVTDPGNAATAKDLRGGWFDAGDYNKYVNFCYGTLTDLLLGFEEKPTVWTDDYNLPESGNGVPDLLDEVKWELDWLLRMQQADGSVLSKVSVTGFQAASPPSADATPRYYGPASTSSTATAAALFALAAIQYKAQGNPAMQAFGNQLHTAAVNAYTWAVNNPNVTYTNAGFQSANPEVDAYERDARRLASAVYLYALTGNASYKSYVDANYQSIHLMAWSYAYPFENGHQSALLYYAKTTGATASVANSIRNTYQTSMKTGNADNLPNYLNGTDAYRAYLSNDNHTWGSNQVRSHQGSMFWAMNQQNLDAANATNYRDAAMGYVHYLHGVNPTGYAYLSNMGGYGAENSVPELYHSWFANGTAFDTNPAPGYVVGGPNKNFAPASGYIAPPQGQPVQKAFKAWNTSYPENSWEITEPAIYYQAAYVRLLSKALGSGTPPPADTQAPTTPTGLAASNVTPTTLTLTWSASTDNVGVSAYEIFQNGTKIGESLTTSLAVGSLSASTAYSFTVKARDAAGNISAASAALSVTTSAASPNDLLVYGDALGATWQNWSWSTTVNPANTSPVKAGTNSLAAQITAGWGGLSLRNDVTLATASYPGGVQFWVYGSGAALRFTTQSEDGSGESPAYAFSPAANVWSLVTLTWAQLGNPTQVKRMTWQDGTGSPQTFYLDDVKFLAGTPPPADTQAPTAPTNLAASNLTSTGCTLTWTASIDKVGVTGYEIFRNGLSIGTATTTSFAATGLSAGTTYSFTVKANDAAGNTSAASNPVSVSPPDTQAPSVPTGLAASAITQTSFTLTWTASSDNVGVTGYEIFRNGTSAGTTTTATTFNVTGLTAATTYSFTVKSRDAAGNVSAASATLSVTTQSPPSANDLVIYGDALNVAWANWSWGLAAGSPNFNNTTPRQVGTRSMAVTMASDWGGLSLRTATPVNPASYPGGIRFWIRAGAGGASIQVYGQTTDGGPATPAKPFDLPANTWQQLSVSWAELGNPSALARLTFQDRGLRAGRNYTFYLDDLKLRAGTARLSAEGFAQVEERPDATAIVDELSIASPYLRVSPVPSTGLFRVGAYAFAAGALLTVIDFSGRTLFEQPLDVAGRESELDLRRYPPGLYLIRVQNQRPAQRAVAKVLIER